MKALDMSLVTQFVNTHIEDFHRARAATLQNLGLASANFDLDSLA